MEPGSPGFNAPDLTVTRFTVPTAGTFDIAGSFTDLQQASVALLIVIDGKTVFSSSFSGRRHIRARSRSRLLASHSRQDRPSILLSTAWEIKLSTSSV
jgi:hypothetical protein